MLLESLDPTVPVKRERRGPTSACDVYGDGDLDDARRVDQLRHEPGKTWKITQRIIDTHLGIDTPIHNDKFRYHWGLRCGHWTDEQRAAGL